MENLIKKLDIEKLSTILIVAVMALLPLTEFICALLDQPFLFQEELVLLLGMCSVILLLLMALKKSQIQFYKSDILIAAMFFFAILSLIFTKDMEQSLYGHHPTYREGILVFLSYYSVAFLASRIIDIKNRKWILKTFLVLAIIETFVGILQFNGLWPYPAYFGDTVAIGESAFGFPTWAFGFTENSNFFGALTVIFTGLTAGLFLLSKGKIRVLSLFLTAFCFYGVITTYCRLSLLGMFGMLCYLFLISIIAHKLKIQKDALTYKNLLQISGIYIIVYLISILITPELLGNLLKFSNELSSGNMNTLGSNRLLIWRKGLETVPKYWYVGTGLDNYVYSFYWNNPDYTGFYQDKGHNEYIHILVTQGIFALTTWLTLIFYNLVTSAKRFFNTNDEESKLTFILIVMYGGYLCQALANSSVTNVAIYNWIITGLLLFTADKKPIKTLKIK